ncbi:MAG TPA: hypothetical protein VKP12_18105 [Kiloniellaceae bacterium]|nr:hypothetical protein [Kiloniellaceae bacterium]
MIASPDTLDGVADDAAMRDAIPLDLAALLTPYRQHRRLSLRVVQLPARAELSAGVRNEDASWSLTPDDLDGLALMLPDDVEPPPGVAVRIVVIDKNENASIVGQFEVPLPRAARARSAAATSSPALAAEWQRRMDRRAAAAKRLAARTAARALAEAETAWRLEWEARLAERVEQCERAANEQLEAALARAAAAEASTAGCLEDARASWQRESAQELAAARQRCAEAEAEVLRLQSRLTEAAAQGEAEAEARHAADAQAVELEWRQKVEAERTARKAAEDKAAAAAQRADALAAELGAAREARAAEAPRTQEGADQQRWVQQQVQAVEARLAAEAKERLMAARAAWRKESDTQTAATVQDAVRKAEALAAARLREAREEWQRESQAALAAAEGQWRIEAARRMSAAQAEWRKSTQAKATAGRRKLRGVARRQGMSEGWRRVGRLTVVAGCMAAAFVLASHFKPTIVEEWAPKVVALAGEAKTAVLSELPWPKTAP